MTARDLLLKAVLASPEDDLPRWVFADHCRESGEESLADFIEVQCRLAEIERAEAADKGTPLEKAMLFRSMGGPALRRRERELFELHGRGNAVWFPVYATAGRHVVVTPTPGDDYGQGNGDVECVVRRGFVEAVACRLDQWCGVECPRCLGGRLTRGSDYHFNPAGGWDHRSSCECGGTGTVPGIGPQVVAAHPVASVTPTDRAPHWNGRGYAWYAHDRRLPPPSVPQSGVLPEEVFDRLTSDGCGGPWWAAYPTVGRANDAVSAALIAWAHRQKALHLNGASHSILGAT